MKTTLLVGFSMVLAFGCGDDDATSDAGIGDAGQSDSAADTALPDAGPEDVGLGEDSGPGDAGPPEDVGTDAGPPTCPDLMPTQGADNVIISQYNLATGEVEFYNPTSEPIPLDGLELCSRPAYDTIDGTGLIVQPGDYATYTASSGFRGASPTRGELALYDSQSYTSRNSMIDFVCWGETLASSRSRKDIAEMTEGEEVLWAGGCSAGPSVNVVARGESNTGTDAADYINEQGFAPHACE